MNKSVSWTKIINHFSEASHSSRKARAEANNCKRRAVTADGVSSWERRAASSLGDCTAFIATDSDNMLLSNSFDDPADEDVAEGMNAQNISSTMQNTYMPQSYPFCCCGHGSRTAVYVSSRGLRSAPANCRTSALSSRLNPRAPVRPPSLEPAL